MKGLRITNIILLSLICLLQAYMLYLGIEMIIGVFSPESTAMLGVALGLIPVFILMIACLAFLTILITITTTILNKKLAANELPKTKFEKACKILPWAFLLFDAALFLFVIIIARSK